jgi:hypothetical protein
MRQSGERRRAKARQASKLTEIRKALVSAGCDTVAKQAAVLGLRRSTTWALFNQDKSAGPSAIVLKRILLSPSLPLPARRKLEDYVAAKVAGLYGHSKRRTQAFRDAFPDRQSGKHTTSFQRRILEPPRERAVESLDLQ